MRSQLAHKKMRFFAISFGSFFFQFWNWKWKRAMDVTMSYFIHSALAARMLTGGKVIETKIVQNQQQQQQRILWNSLCLYSVHLFSGTTTATRWYWIGWTCRIRPAPSATQRSVLIIFRANKNPSMQQCVRALFLKANSLLSTGMELFNSTEHPRARNMNNQNKRWNEQIIKMHK